VDRARAPANDRLGPNATLSSVCVRHCCGRACGFCSQRWLWAS